MNILSVRISDILPHSLKARQSACHWRICGRMNRRINIASSRLERRRHRETPRGASYLWLRLFLMVLACRYSGETGMCGSGRLSRKSLNGNNRQARGDAWLPQSGSALYRTLSLSSPCASPREGTEYFIRGREWLSVPPAKKTREILFYAPIPDDIENNEHRWYRSWAFCGCHP